MAVSLPTSTAIRFHLSLNVSDLARSINFYRILLGTEPAKCRHDYAKFELDDPPLVLSLEPMARPVGGPLNHLGFRLSDSAALAAMQERLERAGVHSQREEGVECCYARQTKFWTTDPDKTLWEIYTFDGDIDHRGAGQSLEAMVPGAVRSSGEVQPVVYEHLLLAPVPERLPFDDATVDEVRLRGSLNVPLDAATQQRLAQESLRVLKPGGRVFVHTLVGDQTLTDPDLPGPAAHVQFVPLENAPKDLIQSAGFGQLRLVKFEERPCFDAPGRRHARTAVGGIQTSTIKRLLYPRFGRSEICWGLMSGLTAARAVGG